MTDTAWLKQLIHATIHDGRLVSEDPEAVRALAASRVEHVASELLAEAQEACTIFNDLRLEARSRAKQSATSRPDLAGDLRVLPLSGPGAKQSDNTAPRGIVLLLGHCQITLEQKGSMLEATATRVIVYQKETRPLYRFVPQVDGFGTLVWNWSGGSGNVLMTHEMIIKKLFEDLLLIALS